MDTDTRGWGGQCAGALALALAWLPCAFALNPALEVSQYAHTAWKYRDGFSKGAIHDMVQTSDGYLWLGTDFGLLRFDGVRNVPWQPPPDQRLPSNLIYRLLAARDGTLWIGTANGLASWKNGKLTRYAELEGLAILALLEDHENSIWAGAYGLPDGKFCEIRTGSVRCHPEMAGLGIGVFGLHEDGKGNLWVGLTTGVWRWKPGPPKFYSVPDQPSGIQNMAGAEDGALLISTTGGVMRLKDGKTEIAYPLPVSMRGFTARRVLRDRDGGLWIGTSGRGIMHLHQGRIDVYSQSDGLTGDFISDFFQDREGNIWAATIDGLDRFRDLPVVTYSMKQGWSDLPGVVLGTRDGSVWFSIPDGMDRIHNGQVTVYRRRGARAVAGGREIAVSGLPERGLGSMFQDSRGRIWISTLTGIGYLENDRFVSIPAAGGFSQAVTEDAAGNLWIANQDHGLIRLSSRNEVQQIPWATFGRKDPAGRLATDPLQGGLWLGFYKGGIAWFRDGQVRASYSASDGLGEGLVSQLRFDEKGALWASSEGGLSRLKDGRIVTLSSKNGLPCDSVQWTIEDDTQSVWLNMPCGLARVARSELDAWAASGDKTHYMISSEVFDSSDGVRNRAISGGYSPRVAKSADGRLWFLILGGISVVDPRHLPFNKLPPPVHVEQITADRKTYDAASGSLRLPPLVRDLEIDYTALSFAAPEKVRFKYKLEGRDPDWLDSGNRRQAFYTDLPPRDYRFRVMACNNSGVWNEAGASLAFAIAPAYYQTGWFRLLIVAASAALLAAFYQMRVRYLKRQFNIGMEARINERTRIAREFHDTLLQSFQGVLMKFSAVTYSIPERPDVQQKLDGILKQARAALTEGRDAVQGLRSSTVVSNNLAAAISTFGEQLGASPASEEAGGNCPEFSLRVEGESRDLPPLVRDEVYRIAGEALRNAFRHAEAKRIEVEIHYDKRRLRMRVRDDGKGIDPQILNAGGRPGHQGMPGMQERAKLCGGKLAVWSEPGSGAEIELTIPAALAYVKSAAAGQSAASGRGTE